MRPGAVAARNAVFAPQAASAGQAFGSPYIATDQPWWVLAPRTGDYRSVAVVRCRRPRTTCGTRWSPRPSTTPSSTGSAGTRRRPARSAGTRRRPRPRTCPRSRRTGGSPPTGWTAPTDANPGDLGRRPRDRPRDADLHAHLVGTATGPRAVRSEADAGHLRAPRGGRPVRLAAGERPAHRGQHDLRPPRRPDRHDPAPGRRHAGRSASGRRVSGAAARRAGIVRPARLGGHDHRPGPAYGPGQLRWWRGPDEILLREIATNTVLHAVDLRTGARRTVYDKVEPPIAHLVVIPAGHLPREVASELAF